MHDLEEKITLDFQPQGEATYTYRNTAEYPIRIIRFELDSVRWYRSPKTMTSQSLFKLIVTSIKIGMVENLVCEAPAFVIFNPNYPDPRLCRIDPGVALTIKMKNQLDANLRFLGKVLFERPKN